MQSEDLDARGRFVLPLAPNRELIIRLEQKIQATPARIWGEPVPTAREMENPMPIRTTIAKNACI